MSNAVHQAKPSPEAVATYWATHEAWRKDLVREIRVSQAVVHKQRLEAAFRAAQPKRFEGAMQ
jgi:hypothetical protein